MTSDKILDVKWLTADSLGTIECKLDVTSAEHDLLGHVFQPYEKQVKDTIEWYVHLSD